jgi:hypothetical protein
MRAAAWTGGLLLGWGLACGGGEADAPATDEPATDAPTDGGKEDDDEGDDDDDPGRDRAARNDCRLGLQGVVAGVPGWPHGDHPAHKGPVQLRTTPRADGRVAFEIDREGAVIRPEPGGGSGKARTVCRWGGQNKEQPCMSVEFEYEGYGLPVFQERRGWVQVAVGPGQSQPEEGQGCRKRAWLQLEEPLEFLDAEAMIEAAKMTHTLPNWDGVMYDGPDGAPRTSGEEGQVWFRKDRTARAGGNLWIEATVIDTHCDTKVERSKGWIPVTDRDGRLQVWFDTAC